MADPDGGLCLIPNTFGEGRMWIKRMGAVNLADPEARPAEGLVIDVPVANVLDSVLAFDGHNRFQGAAGKERTVRELREMVAAGHRPPAEEVEAYAIQSEETDHTGAARLREIYEDILLGRSFRDYRGRPI